MSTYYQSKATCGITCNGSCKPAVPSAVLEDMLASTIRLPIRFNFDRQKEIVEAAIAVQKSIFEKQMYETRIFFYGIAFTFELEKAIAEAFELDREMMVKDWEPLQVEMFSTFMDEHYPKKPMEETMLAHLAFATTDDQFLNFSTKFTKTSRRRRNPHPKTLLLNRVIFFKSLLLMFPRFKK